MIGQILIYVALGIFYGLEFQKTKDRSFGELVFSLTQSIFKSVVHIVGLYQIMLWITQR